MGDRLAALRNLPVVDVAIAVSLAIAAQVEVLYPALAPGTGDVTGSRPVLCLTAALLTLPLAARRITPLTVATVAMVAATAQARLTDPPEGLTTLVALVIAAYSVAAYGERRTVLPGALVVLLTVAGVSTNSGDVAFSAVLLGVAWIGGRAFRRRTARVDELEEGRLAAVAGAATAERERIARELHDIVAHRVSTIVVQAQAADAVLATDPDAARDGLRAIDETAREALGELRALLGVLRHDPATSDRAPQPDISRLPAMIDQARAAGQPVEYVVDGPPRPLPATVALAAYRIAQEALTNILKHAPGAAATVTLAYTPDAVEIVVSDAGPGSANGHQGFGLAGMRERVGYLGGTLESGNRADGGFAVRARLPTDRWDAP